MIKKTCADNDTGFFLIADCRLPIAGCRLSVAGCRLSIADCRLPIAGVF